MGRVKTTPWGAGTSLSLRRTPSVTARTGQDRADSRESWLSRQKTLSGTQPERSASSSSVKPSQTKRPSALRFLEALKRPQTCLICGFSRLVMVSMQKPPSGSV